METRSIKMIIRALNDAKVRYPVVAAWRPMRMVSFGRRMMSISSSSLNPANIVRCLQALIAVGYPMHIPVSPEQSAEAPQRESWRLEKGMFVMKMWSDEHRRTPEDVFVYEPFELAREYENAMEMVITRNIEARVVTFDTLLQMKRAAGARRRVAVILIASPI